MGLKEKLKILILGYKANSNTYIAHLKKIGMDIGEDVVLFRPYNTNIDMQNPHMISIGNHVMITGPSTILSHDYSWCVIKRKYGYIYGNQRKTVIGDNVFIGWGSTILGGTIIGDNVIIGANSVVTGTVESNSVYAGNPAKKIMSLAEFAEHRKANQLNEAVEFVKEYSKTYGHNPKEKEMKEYFFIFANEDKLCPEFKFQLNLLGNYKESLEKIKECKQFDSFDMFMEYCSTK